MDRHWISLSARVMNRAVAKVRTARIRARAGVRAMQTHHSHEVLVLI